MPTDNIIKMEKLTCITEMALSLEELDNIDNLEDERLSNILLRYYVTGSEEFTSFELVTSPTLRIMDQKENSIIDGLGMTIVLHIR